MAESLREKSRRNWTNDANTDGNIQLGCMLRIADATEKMAQRHTDLIEERDRLSRYYRARGEQIARLERQLSAHKGQITKLKRQLAAGKEAS